MSYAVGQIIYALSNKETKVIPVQVVEVLFRKTLSGEETSYMVMLPDRKRTVAPLEKLQVEIFTSPEDLRHFMLKNATHGINNLINSALNISSETFTKEENDLIDPGGLIKPDTVDTESVQESAEINMGDGMSGKLNFLDDNIVEVDMGNGIKGKINLQSIENV